MTVIVVLLVLAFAGWIIFALVDEFSSKPPKPPATLMPPAKPLPRPGPGKSPPTDSDFVILSRTDIPPPAVPDPWTRGKPPRSGAQGSRPDARQGAGLGNVTINLNAVCMLTGAVVRDCKCDQHRHLKG